MSKESFLIQDTVNKILSYIDDSDAVEPLVLKDNTLAKACHVSRTTIRAALKIVEEKHDFIFAIGDDTTDEYLFEELPERAFTIKVGSKNTVAKYNISNIKKVHEMIQNFI